MAVGKWTLCGVTGGGASNKWYLCEIGKRISRMVCGVTGGGASTKWYIGEIGGRTMETIRRYVSKRL